MKIKGIQIKNFNKTKKVFERNNKSYLKTSERKIKKTIIKPDNKNTGAKKVTKKNNRLRNGQGFPKRKSRTCFNRLRLLHSTGSIISKLHRTLRLVELRGDNVYSTNWATPLQWG